MQAVTSRSGSTLIGWRCEAARQETSWSCEQERHVLMPPRPSSGAGDTHGTHPTPRHSFPSHATLSLSLLPSPFPCYPLPFPTTLRLLPCYPPILPSQLPSYSAALQFCLLPSLFLFLLPSSFSCCSLSFPIHWPSACNPPLSLLSFSTLPYPLPAIPSLSLLPYPHSLTHLPYYSFIHSLPHPPTS